MTEAETIILKEKEKNAKFDALPDWKKRILLEKK